MPKSTRNRPADKPAKPCPDFPLFAHANGLWAKKIRGKLHYFGPWADPDAALRRYLADKEDLHAGRTPGPKLEGLTIRELVNEFLTSKQAAVDAGEITRRYFRDLHATCERMIDVFGRQKPVAALGPADFERLRNAMAKTLSPVSRKVEIAKTKSVFHWGIGMELIAPLRFGPAFKSPPKKVVEKARAANGSKMFEPEEIRPMIDAAGPRLRAMILLGINCGFGNHDCATLTFQALDLDRGWVAHPRPKTAVERRCWLWPETVEALREAIGQRPRPRDPAHAGLVFLTKQGRPFVRMAGSTWHDCLGRAFRDLLMDLGLRRQGRLFYGLRHSFRTVADATGDWPAIDKIMGHADRTMAGRYRQRIDDDRIEKVSRHVRHWLFGKDSQE